MPRSCRGRADKVFKPIRSFFKRHGLDATYATKVDVATDIIIDAANRGRQDLIVMGSHSHSSIGNLVMGSVATKVLAGCATPVLLIR
ncbi:MAG: universal stress protein [Pseudomonadota bacterium]|nr:universal stress protein [Pseudomonadota bacterium]